MNLVKYCKASHAEDATNKGRIFIGTFSIYKTIENESLRDIEEGIAIPAVVDYESNLEISEDDNNTLLLHSSIKLANGWKLNMPKGMPLWLEQPSFNTFIYCVSDDPTPSIEKAKRLGYDSFFRITDPFNFGQALMFSISQHFGSMFGVKGDMGHVNYVPRKIQVVNRLQPSSPLKSFTTMELFTKHEKFKDDREFRYIVMEYSNAEKTEFNSLKTDGEIIENLELTKWITSA